MIILFFKFIICEYCDGIWVAIFCFCDLFSVWTVQIISFCNLWPARTITIDSALLSHINISKNKTCINFSCPHRASSKCDLSLYWLSPSFKEELPWSNPGPLRRNSPWHSIRLRLQQQKIPSQSLCMWHWKFFLQDLIAIHAVGDVRIDFQYQQMPLPVMPIYVRNCEKENSAAKIFVLKEGHMSKESAVFVCKFLGNAGWKVQGLAERKFSLNLVLSFAQIKPTLSTHCNLRT